MCMYTAILNIYGYIVPYINNNKIIQGHSLRRACLQPATNTQNSKPRPPTSNARSKGKLEN